MIPRLEDVPFVEVDYYNVLHRPDFSKDRHPHMIRSMCGERSMQKKNLKLFSRATEYKYLCATCFLDSDKD